MASFQVLNDDMRDNSSEEGFAEQNIDESRLGAVFTWMPTIWFSSEFQAASLISSISCSVNGILWQSTGFMAAVAYTWLMMELIH